jgi:predicted nucleic acid-binding protein
MLSYIDTSIWISGLYESELKHGIAKAIIEDLRNKGAIIVSQWVLNEILDALKGKAVSDKNINQSLRRAFQYSPQASADPLERYVKRKNSEFVASFLKLQNVRILTPDNLRLEKLETAHQILLNSFGHFEKLDNCKVCGMPFTYLRHIAPSLLDVIHLLAAHEIGCKEFWTFDRGIGKAQLPLGVSLDPMKIIIR